MYVTFYCNADWNALFGASTNGIWSHVPGDIQKFQLPTAKTSQQHVLLTFQNKLLIIYDHNVKKLMQIFKYILCNYKWFQPIWHIGYACHVFVFSVGNRYIWMSSGSWYHMNWWKKVVFFIDEFYVTFCGNFDWNALFDVPTKGIWSHVPGDIQKISITNRKNEHATCIAYIPE